MRVSSEIRSKDSASDFKMKILLFVFLLGRPLRAETYPVLLELFSSQGCSSCPPAEDLILSLDKEQPAPGLEIIPICFHVDYWNYLGWSDPYSSSTYTQRQYAYAKRWQAPNVFTPEAVINGSSDCSGSDRNAILKLAKGLHRLGLKRLGDKIEISDVLPAAELYVVLTEDGLINAVSRREFGRTLRSHAVVRSLKKLGIAGAEVFWLIPEKSENMDVVVFQQEADMGPIVAAGRIRL